MNKYKEIIQEAHDLWDENRLEEALELLEEAQDYNFDLDLESINDMGLIYFELGKYDLSNETFIRLLEYDDEFYGAYLGIGMLKEKDGLIDEAIELYLESINFNDDNPLAYFSLANLYDDKGLKDLAIEYYEKTIELNKEHFWAHINLGSIYEERNDYDNALIYFNLAYTIDSENAISSFNLGVVYQNTNELDLAKKYYLQAMNSEIPYIYAFLNYGVMLKDSFDDLKGALNAYSEGIKVDPNNSVLYYNRGCVYALLNKEKNAINDIKKSISLNQNLYDYMLEDEELKDIKDFVLLED